MTTRIHHLNCATMRPRGSFFGVMTPTHFIAHCLLVERAEGFTLVDSGFGTADLADPRRLGTPFLAGMRPALAPAETALAQLQALGYAAGDVTDVVLTHLDLDHAGGIGDFPDARIHVYDAELEAALHPRTLAERRRYLSAQWAHGPQWVSHAVSGEDWHGFDHVSVIGEDILLVPLHGHTRGHSGVAVRRPAADGGGWLLHAGDSYFFTGEKQTPVDARLALTVFQKALAADEKARAHNQERLQELHRVHGEDITIFSAHDRSEYLSLVE